MILSKIFPALSELSPLTVFIRLFSALVIGGIIGFGRDRKGYAAGFRTHILVCIGAALTMLINQYAFELFGGDPTRMGAQVISGIGFLGAGSIIINGKNQIKGVTTAAGLWTTACIGLAIGIGFYEAAALGCLFVYAVETVLNRISPKKTGDYSLCVTLSEGKTVGELLMFLQAMGITPRETRRRGSGEERSGYILTFDEEDAEKRSAIYAAVSEFEGVTCVSE